VLAATVTLFEAVVAVAATGRSGYQIPGITGTQGPTWWRRDGSSRKPSTRYAQAPKRERLLHAVTLALALAIVEVLRRAT
jgi:hypothetical protein